MVKRKSVALLFCHTSYLASHRSYITEKHLWLARHYGKLGLRETIPFKHKSYVYSCNTRSTKSFPHQNHYIPKFRTQTLPGAEVTNFFVYIHESVHADLNSQILRLEKLVQN
jgi:hypothetical protein